MVRPALLLAPLTVSLVLAQLGPLDTSVDPCVDFYAHSCNVWMKQNPLPGDQARWGAFHLLGERNQTLLRSILDKAAGPSGPRTPVEQKIGDFYAACMDEGQVQKIGLRSLRPLLDQVEKLGDRRAIGGLLARLHLGGVGGLFFFASAQDLKDSTKVVALAFQGGLGLPDRELYLKEDARSKQIREKYVAHVGRMFGLLGRKPEQAEQQAAIVMALETTIAKGSLDRVTLRDPNKRYYSLTPGELIALTPHFDWKGYFAGAGVPRLERLTVTTPDFMKMLDATIASEPLDHWKAYLTWHLVHGAAPALPEEFVKETFEFFGKTLTGAKELKPRWKRCVDMTDQQLGEALGQKYVEAAFAGDSKARMLDMVHRLEKAVERDILALDWMTPETKKRAIEKLHVISNKIGYPDKWRDYSSVKIVRGDLLGNVVRASEFEFRRDLAKIGKPVDKTQWGMTPPTVNAYFSQTQNNINFPAGILQPPFFDARRDDAVNYGGIGAVIGHEITHGFDDQGRKFDGGGNLKDWWTETDAKEFEKRVACIQEQYSSYTATGDVRLNGRLTLGENTADSGGVRVAYLALLDLLAEKPQGTLDGLTPQQRFFYGYAQIWCLNATDESKRMRALTDPHAPGNYRVNGVVSNMPEFRGAFGCREGQPMVRANACRVW
ncbi:MAG: M13 family metallopeptidase [Bryobacteraceae bacterium]